MPFSERVYAGYIPSLHHKYVAGILEKAIARVPGYDRIVLHEPPQHGKSLQVSTIFPSWYLGHYPDDPIIVLAYGDEHAMSFSRRIRNIINSDEYSTVFPGVKMAEDSRAQKRWELHPHKGSMIAAGIFGAVTGKGAKLLILDDPLKNRQEAESKTHRMKILEEWKSTIKTRIHDDAIVIIVATRWHENDLSGYLIEEEGFKYVCLSALAEKDDVLGRKKMRPLWKEKFPQSMLMKIKEEIGSYNWSALYQGHPAPPEGAFFKRHHFDICEKNLSGMRSVRYWDLATGDKTDSSFTVGLKASQSSDGHIYLSDRLRGKWQWHHVRGLIKQTALGEKGTMVGIESQGVQQGMAQECLADPDLASVGVFPVPVPMSKQIRALATVAKGEAGKLHLIKAPWNEEFIEEHISFPQAEFDDQVDASSGCMHLLGLMPSRITNLNEYLGEDVHSEEVIASTRGGQGFTYI